MLLSWNDVKSRALAFSKTWATASNEDSQAKPFLIDLFEVFGVTNKRLASFDRPMREALLAACALDWSRISPAIFGSLFQSIMDSDARRNLGAHYTSE